ncbi:NHL repeat-containing protein [Massilia sp. W12]|uniref:NHL repeat-containing protein n=1 Tax=Massilia sp. W12 TaxID=3126507 RepID=UPI0030CDC76D
MMSQQTVFTHVGLYGQTAQEAPDRPGPIPQDFTFNSLVGCALDSAGRVWVCDTGNDRVLVLDQQLGQILRVLNFPQAGAKGGGGVHFRMPFHVCRHPVKNLMYITDMGNSRVVVMEYDAKQISFSHVFGNVLSNGGLPLQDPNGITVVRDAKGKYFVHVNDEFFHTPADPRRNRCVRFTEAGEYVNEFRTMINPDGTRHDLYWPQGLSSDHRGNLYLANTGSYEILKCDANAKVDADYCIHAERPVVQHRFGQPRGMGTMNIMRDVSVVGEYVFVPDQTLNTISVYDLDGRLLTHLCGVKRVWNHGNITLNSPTDPVYYFEENNMLLNPYVICGGEAPDIYYVTEPFTSRLLKLRIPQMKGKMAQMSLLGALGARRNQPGDAHTDPQFNVVSAVEEFKPQRLLKPTVLGNPAQEWQTLQELPPWFKYNPWEWAYLAWAAVSTSLYAASAGIWMDYWLSLGQKQQARSLRLNLDAGNWALRAYLEEKDGFQPVREPIQFGPFAAGNISLTLHYPQQPLLGQICPGTPILLTANFDFGMVSMYQLTPSGSWINYGLPFGIYGQADGCMRGPQGMAVSDDGQIFIADSLNDRIAKWQLLQTGQVVFIKNFVWQAEHKGPQRVFTPVDVALDGARRLFVTDQFNNRICVFDMQGNSLWSYGREGYWQEGQPDGDHFMLPTSLAIDEEFLILNDLVNRALKLFRIREKTLEFMGGISLFKLHLQDGGVWMPYFMCARDGEVYIADSTYNVVQVFRY